MIGLAGGAKDLAQDLDQDLAEMATLGSLLTSSSKTQENVSERRKGRNIKNSPPQQ